MRSGAFRPGVLALRGIRASGSGSFRAGRRRGNVLGETAKTIDNPWISTVLAGRPPQAANHVRRTPSTPTKQNTADFSVFSPAGGGNTLKSAVFCFVGVEGVWRTWYAAWGGRPARTVDIHGWFVALAVSPRTFPRRRPARKDPDPLARMPLSANTPGRQAPLLIRWRAQQAAS